MKNKTILLIFFISSILTLSINTNQLQQQLTLIDTATITITNSNTISERILQTTNVNSDFPVPFTIVTAVIAVACAISKLQFHNTFIVGALYSLISIVQSGALGYFIYLYYVTSYSTNQLPFYLAASSLGFLYLLNILALFLQTMLFCTDQKFKQWNGGYNRCAVLFITIISTIINHKFRNILFCKLFSFFIFSAIMQNVAKFKILNIFSFISIIHSVIAIFGAILAIIGLKTNTQLFYACIDVIIVTGLMIILAFINVIKPDDFFQEKTSQGLSLNKIVVIEQEAVQNKLDPLSDAQHQIRNYNKMSHVKGSYQQFKVHHDVSMDSLSDKQYRQMSVQVLQLINDQTQKTGGKFYQVSQINNQPMDSNFTIVFDKVDQGVQNSIEKIKKQQLLIDRSIQLSQQSKQEKSIQKDNNFNDKSVQRTIVLEQQKSMQYAPSMISNGPSLKNQSVGMSNRFSYRNKSVQKEPTVSNKQIMMKPQTKQQQGQYSINMIDQAIQNYNLLEDRGMQAVQTYADQGNQKSVSIRQQSVQMFPTYQKDISIQKQIQHNDYSVQIEYKPDPIKYDQYTQQIMPSKSQNMVFDQNQQKNEGLLNQAKKDEFSLPKYEIKSYQQQLQDRIRQKQKQLQKIKTKIQIKQRQNQQKKKGFNKKKQQNTKIVDIGKIYYKPMNIDYQQQNSKQVNESQIQRQNHALKRQQRQIRQEDNVGEQSKTIQQIQFNEQPQRQQQQRQIINNSNQTQQQFIDMLQGNQNIVDEENYQQSRQQTPSGQISKNIQTFKNNQSLKKYQLHRQSQQEYVSQEKNQRSTKLGSDIRMYVPKRNHIKLNSGTDSPAIVVSQVDQSLNSQQSSINQRPAIPNQINQVRSDIEDISQKFHGGNRTLEVIKIDKQKLAEKMKSSVQTGMKRDKRLPQDRQDPYINKRDNYNIKFQQPKNYIRQKSTMLLAGQSQFTEQRLARKNINKASTPLKSHLRWEYENQDKNLSDSGQFQVPNKRVVKKSHLILPFETDKQQTQFKQTQIKISENIRVPTKKSIPRQESKLNQQDIQNPINNIPHKPKINQMASQMSEQPYIDDEDDSDYANKYKNDMILGQLLDRPSRNQMKTYYRQTGSKSKQKSKGKTSGLEKIYLQRLDKNKG